jgi:hypothetical protein
MARLILGIVGVAIIGLAVWAAMPARTPSDSPLVGGPASAAPGPPTSRAPAQPVSAAAAAPTAVAAPTGDDATDTAIAGCVGAQLMVMQQRQQRGGPAPPGQPSDAAVVSKACAPLYKQAACREAMLNYDEPPPEVRSSTVLQKCARAYCPTLSAPKPPVCDHVDNVPQDIQQFQEWAQLRDAILIKEIGPSAAQLVANPPRRPQAAAAPPLR